MKIHLKNGETAVICRADGTLESVVDTMNEKAMPGAMFYMLGAARRIMFDDEEWLEELNDWISADMQRMENQIVWASKKTEG